MKCPFCIMEGLPGDLNERDFCNEQVDQWILKQNHVYYDFEAEPCILPPNSIAAGSG